MSVKLDFPNSITENAVKFKLRHRLLRNERTCRPFPTVSTRIESRFLVPIMRTICIMDIKIRTVQLRLCFLCTATDRKHYRPVIWGVVFVGLKDVRRISTVLRCMAHKRKGREQNRQRTFHAKTLNARLLSYLLAGMSTSERPWFRPIHAERNQYAIL